MEYEQSYININDIEKDIKKLNIPPEYWKINLRRFFTHQYNFYLSIRENAGKTTQALILGLCLNRRYGTTTEYIRNDEKQTSRSKIESLYETVVNLGYIEKVYPKMYNDVEYSQNKKAFFLVWRDDEGAIIKRSEKPLCVIHSNENWKLYKSSYNNPKGDYIIVDELMDSDRATLRQMTELMNNVSTIGRIGSPKRRNNVHVLLLGNNTDEFSHWWDDFTIADEVKALKNFGSHFEKVTELGVTVDFNLIGLNENKKEELKTKKIPFFGFNTTQMAQFNGTQVWAGFSYPQIPEVEMLDFNHKINDDFYILHRDHYIQICLYYNEDNNYYVYCHWANKPKLDTRIVLTLNPFEKNEFYGLAEYTDATKVSDAVRTLMRLRKENRWYYNNNQIGCIIDDYIKNCS